MKQVLEVFFLAAIVASSGIVSASAFWPFGPNSYEECITKEMKGISSDVAARAVIAACRKKFPKEPDPSLIVCVDISDVKSWTIAQGNIITMVKKTGIYDASFRVPFCNVSYTSSISATYLSAVCEGELITIDGVQCQIDKVKYVLK